MGKSKSKLPSVEVIILTHNRIQNIKKCLRSLKKTNYGNLKITLVDQDSQDGTFDYVMNNYHDVNLIKNKKNKSFSEGNNLVLKQSKAKYCILLNDDTEQDPSWIEEMVIIAERNDKIAALQPKILSMNRRDFEYAGACGGFIDIYGYPICRGRVFDTIEKDSSQYDDKRKIFWASGAAIFLRTEILKKAGYLDEFLGSYAEEVDLCWRLNLLGYDILVVPRSVVYHKGSATWGKKKNVVKKNFLIHRNHWIILFKNYSPKNLFKIVFLKLFLEILTFLGFIFTNPKKSLAVLLANLWVVFNLAKLLRKNRENRRIRKDHEKEIISGMINTSVALNYYLLRKKRKFTDYMENIKSY